MAFTRAPKYQQVADALRDEISSGQLAPAAPLPSEARLMERFDVSRPTARAAVQALAAEGLVTVIHGKGAFVRLVSDRPSYTHQRGITRTDITVDQQPDGHTGAARYADTDIDSPDWRLVEEPAFYRADATAELALVLGIAEHAPLFVGDRLLTDKAGRRLSHRLYLPVATCLDVPELAENPYRTPGDLYTALTTAGHNLAWVEQVRAKLPTPDDAATLHIPDATPMLVTRRVTIACVPDKATGGETTRALALEETRLSAEDTQLAYAIAPCVAP